MATPNSVAVQWASDPAAPCRYAMAVSMSVPRSAAVVAEAALPVASVAASDSGVAGGASAEPVPEESVAPIALARRASARSRSTALVPRSVLACGMFGAGASWTVPICAT